jgi:hypothetical protein
MKKSLFTHNLIPAGEIDFNLPAEYILKVMDYLGATDKSELGYICATDDDEDEIWVYGLYYTQDENIPDDLPADDHYAYGALCYGSVLFNQISVKSVVAMDASPALFVIKISDHNTVNIDSECDVSSKELDPEADDNTVRGTGVHVVYPGYVDHNENAVFISKKSLSALFIKNILSVISTALNTPEYFDIHLIQKEIYEFFENNKLVEFKNDDINSEEFYSGTLVRLSYLKDVLTKLVAECKSIEILNISFNERQAGITDANDDSRNKYAFVSRYDNLTDCSDFVCLGALVRNVLNDLIYDTQLCHKANLPYDTAVVS